MRFAIDLLWLRPNQVGGTEFYIRNLLDGFLKSHKEFEITLLVSLDNQSSFRHYAEDKRFQLLIANMMSENIGKRIIWQNLFQNRLLRKNGLENCFVPVYCRPFFNGKIKYINTIHDLQAKYYPNYHAFYEVLFTEMCWWTATHRSKAVIATTEYVLQDLIKEYHIPEKKRKVLPIPVIVDENDGISLETIEELYGIKNHEYYYTVAQNIPHKNLVTLIRVMRQIIDRELELPPKLVITGIEGNASKNVNQLITELELEEHVVFTGFIDNSTRNTLYKNAKAFLFPSIFEGFGIPPVEALKIGVPVVTTRCTSIPEVTKGQAIYVNDPKCVDEWIAKMKEVGSYEQLEFTGHELMDIAMQCLEYFEETFQ